jgi:hypothetical protein
MKIFLWSFRIYALVFSSVAFAGLPILPTSANPASSYVAMRAEILALPTQLTVRAYFEHQDKIGGLQDCLFVLQNGTPTDEQKSLWGRAVKALNAATWKASAGVSDTLFGNDVRTDFLDQQGLVRKSLWNDSATGFLTVGALFDASGHALALVRYLHVKTLTTSTGTIPPCDQTKTQVSPILPNSRPGGSTEIQQLVAQADQIVSGILLDNFRSTEPLTVSATATPTSAPTAIQTAVPTAIPTAILSHVPTSVPTAIPKPAATLLPTAAPTAIPTALPTAMPTIVPTAVPTALPKATATSIPTIVATAVSVASPTKTIPKAK